MSRERITDTEVYKRYCLIGFIDPATRKIVSVEAIDKPFPREDREWLRSYMKKYQTIGFNSINFDLPIIYGAIAGLTPREIKRIADSIIIDDLKPWDVEDEWKFKIPRNLDHIDLIEVAPGSGSLKIFNGRLHGKRMQDLPVEPDADVSDDDIDTIYEYWKNDLDATINVKEGLRKQLDLRTEMSFIYDIDLRSKSDAQIAEAVIKSGVTKILGKAPVKPKLEVGKNHRYIVPDFITYYSDNLLDMLDKVEAARFKVSPSGKILMPEYLSEAQIKIGNSVYRMGIGGLHSSEKCASYVSDDEYVLIDRDVASYYPRIILNLGLYPKQLGKAFLKVYEKIVNTRLKAKAEAQRVEDEIRDLEKGMKESNSRSELREERLEELKAELRKFQIEADGLKITINGSFGKFGSKWSILFAPDLLIQTTVTGQLSLLMLIERLERKGFEVISGNTDGIIIRCKRTRIEECEAVVKKWEADTGFETEANEYSAVYSRDVNNYIAVKAKDGKAKRKGAFAKSGLEEKKNPSFEICSDAVVEYITKGTPVGAYIKECKDIRKFIRVQTVKGGATKDGEYLGKAIRWYRSRSTTTAIHYKKANATGNFNKVPLSDNGMPVMMLPDEFPTDIDYSWYIKEARDILIDIAYDQDLIGKPTRKKKVKIDA